MRKKRSKPKGSSKDLSKEKIFALASVQCSQSEIAAGLYISEKEFSRRLKDDPELKAAMEKGQVRGRVKVKRALYRGMMDHHITICKECGKTTDEPFKFWDICPLCLSSNIKHSYKAGNPKMLEIFMKNFEDLDKISSSEEETPLYKTLAEFTEYATQKKREQEAIVRARSSPS